MKDRLYRPDKHLSATQIERLRTMESRLRDFGLTPEERQTILDEVQDVYRHFKGPENSRR